MKNKVNCVHFTPAPDVKIRVIRENDSQQTIKDKKDKPFKLNNTVKVTINTDNYNLYFFICDGFKWNGADIPKPLWWIGSSKDNSFLTASMVHDFMLTQLNKQFIYYKLLDGKIPPNEFRKLTSDILCYLFIQSGISELKARFMASCVDFYQKTINFRAWLL